MAFQSSVNRVNTYGIQGDLANGQVPHYTPTTPRVAANDSIEVGGFAWVSDSNGVATAKSADTGAPTGIVQRVKDVPNYTIKSEGSLAVPAGRKCDVIVWGDVFVKVPSAAVGKVLYANNTTGAITCDAAGQTVSGSTETNWKIISLANNAAAAGGSICIVSNVK